MEYKPLQDIYILENVTCLVDEVSTAFDKAYAQAKGRRLRKCAKFIIIDAEYNHLITSQRKPTLFRGGGKLR